MNNSLEILQNYDGKTVLIKYNGGDVRISMSGTFLDPKQLDKINIYKTALFFFYEYPFKKQLMEIDSELGNKSFNIKNIETLELSGFELLN